MNNAGARAVSMENSEQSTRIVSADVATAAGIIGTFIHGNKQPIPSLPSFSSSSTDFSRQTSEPLPMSVHDCTACAVVSTCALLNMSTSGEYNPIKARIDAIRELTQANPNFMKQFGQKERETIIREHIQAARQMSLQEEQSKMSEQAPPASALHPPEPSSSPDCSLPLVPKQQINEEKEEEPVKPSLEGKTIPITANRAILTPEFTAFPSIEEMSAGQQKRNIALKDIRLSKPVPKTPETGKRIDSLLYRKNGEHSSIDHPFDETQTTDRSSEKKMHEKNPVLTVADQIDADTVPAVVTPGIKKSTNKSGFLPQSKSIFVHLPVKELPLKQVHIKKKDIKGQKPFIVFEQTRQRQSTRRIAPARSVQDGAKPISAESIHNRLFVAKADRTPLRRVDMIPIKVPSGDKIKKSPISIPMGNLPQHNGLRNVPGGNHIDLQPVSTVSLKPHQKAREAAAGRRLRRKSEEINDRARPVITELPPADLIVEPVSKRPPSIFKGTITFSRGRIDSGSRFPQRIAETSPLTHVHISRELNNDVQEKVPLPKRIKQESHNQKVRFNKEVSPIFVSIPQDAEKKKKHHKNNLAERKPPTWEEKKSRWGESKITFIAELRGSAQEVKKYLKILVLQGKNCVYIALEKDTVKPIDKKEYSALRSGTKRKRKDRYKVYSVNVYTLRRLRDHLHQLHMILQSTRTLQYICNNIVKPEAAGESFNKAAPEEFIFGQKKHISRLNFQLIAWYLLHLLLFSAKMVF